MNRRPQFSRSFAEDLLLFSGLVLTLISLSAWIFS